MQVCDNLLVEVSELPELLESFFLLLFFFPSVEKDNQDTLYRPGYWCVVTTYAAPQFREPCGHQLSHWAIWKPFSCIAILNMLL